MRNLLRNPEIRRECLCTVCVTLAIALIGWLLTEEPLTPLLVLLLGTLCLVLQLYFVRNRYQEMSALSTRIDEILHGQQTALISDCAEGELSILVSEIGKMTVRLQEQASRMGCEKAELARAMEDIFHQFRTPLTALQLDTALLAEEDLPLERRLAMTRKIRRQLQRMEWLTEALLKMSRIDAGTVLFRRDEVPVRTLVERAAAPLAVPMELREQTLVCTAGEETLLVDPAWTVEALGNLLKNCMEHTPPGGTITVSCEDNPLYTAIVVQDTGSGFDPGDLPHIFERFYRGKNAGPESVGIGLAPARLIAAEQNGTLTADNPPEGGARFILRFNKRII